MMSEKRRTKKSLGRNVVEKWTKYKVTAPEAVVVGGRGDNLPETRVKPISPSAWLPL